MVQGSPCPGGEVWQKYLLDPDLTERVDLESHLNDCSICRFLVGQLEVELNELQAVWSRDVPSGFIRLALLTVDEISEEPATNLLAAEGNGETSEVTAVTLTSPDDKIILRAMRDSRSGEVWLYLLADDSAMCQNVLVRPFESSQEYLTDDQGRVNLGAIAWPGLEELTAEVCLPKATFHLSPTSDFSEPESEITIDSPGGDRIRVSFEGTGRNRRLSVRILKVAGSLRDAPLRVALRRTGTDHATHVSGTTLEVVSFEDVGNQETLEIYLYQ